MYIYLFLCLFCVAVRHINADDTLDSDIEKLPSDVKQKLYERIARRIFNEVKVKQLSNASEVFVSKDQLKGQDAFIKKLLKEEQLKLRKSFEDVPTNATKKNETKKNNEGDKKTLRNEHLQPETKAFVDLTKRSIPQRRNAESENLDSKIYTVKPIQEYIKEETTTISNRAQNKINGTVLGRLINSNTNNTTETTPYRNSSNESQDITLNSTEKSISENISVPENITDNTKEQTMIQIDSLPDIPTTENLEDDHKLRTEDLDGEHVVKNLNVSILRSKDENATGSNEGEKLRLEPKKMQPVPKKSSEEDLMVEIKNKNSSDLASEKTTEKTLEVEEITEKTTTLPDLNKNTEAVTLKVETIEETTTKTDIEDKGLEKVKSKKPRNENISININVESQKHNIESTTVFISKIEIGKSEANSSKDSNKEIGVNVNVSLGDKAPNAKVAIDTTIGNLHKKINENEKVKQHKGESSVTVETKPDAVRDGSHPSTPAIRLQLFDVVNPNIISVKDEKSGKILKSDLKTKSEPYFVFEAPADRSAFKPVIDESAPAETENIEQPEEVPIHNYDPANAYYNPHKYYGPDSYDITPVRIEANDADNKASKNQGNVNESPVNKNNLLLKTFDFKVEPSKDKIIETIPDDLQLLPKSDDIEYMESINFEEPQMVPVHNYDPANAYYNPSKFFDAASNENTLNFNKPQKNEKYKVEKELDKNLQNIHISTGNKNDIIFQAFEFKTNKNQPKNFDKIDQKEDSDNYILNFLKKKHKISKNIILNPRQKTNNFKDNDDGEYVVIQNLIAKTKLSGNKRKKRGDGTKTVKSFFSDSLFSAENKLNKNPKRQMKSKTVYEDFKKHLEKLLRKNKNIDSIEVLDKNIDSIEVLEQKQVKTRPKRKIKRKQQELTFLNNALDELFNTKSNFAKNNPRKRSHGNKNANRETRDIAHDYYFEREDISRPDDTNELSPQDKNNIPEWEDNSSMEGSKMDLKDILENSNNNKEPVTVPKEAVDSTENESVLLQLKKIFTPKSKSVESDSADKACAIKREIQVYLNVLQDMIDTNSDALETFDWLGTTVDILATIEKLEELSEKYFNNEKLPKKDYQILKFFVNLHKVTDEKIKAMPKCEEQESEEFYRYEQNNKEELIIAPRDFTMKRKKDAAGDALKLFNDYFYQLFKNKKNRRKGSAEVSDVKDLLYLNEFLTALRQDMFELHLAVRNIASVTKFSTQNWYRDLKNIFLKPAKRKHLLGVLLHIAFIRVLDLVEVAIPDGISDNYVQFIVQNGDDFDRIVEKTDFVKAIMQEIAAQKKVS